MRRAFVAIAVVPTLGCASPTVAPTQPAASEEAAVNPEPPVPTEAEAEPAAAADGVFYRASKAAAFEDGEQTRVAASGRWAVVVGHPEGPEGPGVATARVRVGAEGWGAPLSLRGEKAELLGHGAGIAVAGDTIALSTMTPTEPAFIELFEFDDGRWSATDRISGRHGWFGATMGMSNDVLLASNLGEWVELFERRDVGWARVAELRRPEDAGLYGLSLATAGEWAAVSSEGSSRVFMHARSGGAWPQTQVLEGPPASGFGCAVAMAGRWLVVGACREDGARGAAYLFALEGKRWTQQQRWTAPGDREAGAGFGTAVATDGTHVLVGAPSASSADGRFSGEVFRLVQTDAGWNVTPVPYATAAGERYGISLAIADGVGLAGALNSVHTFPLSSEAE